MTGLIYDDKTSTVTGIRIKKRKDKKGDHEKEPTAEEPSIVGTDILADVIVCSSGRRSQLEKWLAAIGVVIEGKPIPQESAFPGLGYCTSIWRPPAGTFNSFLSSNQIS